MSAENSARSVRQADGLDPVRALQRVLYRSAKQDRTRRFHALFDKLARSDVMWRAWVDVATNQGAPGVDGVTIADVEAGGTESVRAFLDGLAAELRAETYRPEAAAAGAHPQAGQAGRDPAARHTHSADRVVMTAAKIVLEPIFEADFLPSSFGFRPKRSAHQALEAVRVAANRGAQWVLDADIKSCFAEIDHEALIAQVERRVVDRQMLKLLQVLAASRGVRGRGGLRYGGRDPAGLTRFPADGQHRPPRARRGVGGDGLEVGDAGPLLRRSRRRLPHPGTGRSRPGTWRRGTLADLGLRLHPDKTRVVYLRQGQEGFDFLGFHHRMVRPAKRPGRYYLQKWPSRRAMASIRAKIRRSHPPRLRQLRNGHGGRIPQPRTARLGGVLPLRELVTEVQRRRRLRPPEAGQARQRQVRAPRLELGHPFYLRWLTSLGIYRLTGTVRYGLRMPDDERCRRAVCGRTACTVR